jgi:hypothetical protein
LTVFIPTGGEFQIAAADEIQQARIVTLVEERSLRGQSDCAGSKFEIGEHRTSQRTKPAWASVGAGCAARWNLPRCLLVPSVLSYRDPCICHRLATSDVVKASERGQFACSSRVFFQGENTLRIAGSRLLVYQSLP